MAYTVLKRTQFKFVVDVDDVSNVLQFLNTNGILLLAINYAYNNEKCNVKIKIVIGSVSNTDYDNLWAFNLSKYFKDNDIPFNKRQVLVVFANALSYELALAQTYNALIDAGIHVRDLYTSRFDGFIYSVDCVDKAEEILLSINIF